MGPLPNPPAGGMLRRLLAGMPVFSIVMTIPQVATIWLHHQAAGVSVASWSAYLLDAAVVVGALVYA